MTRDEVEVLAKGCLGGAWTIHERFDPGVLTTVWRHLGVVDATPIIRISFGGFVAQGIFTDLLPGDVQWADHHIGSSTYIVVEDSELSQTDDL